jgi:RNA polymerase sigma factor (sigma-70 family)
MSKIDRATIIAASNGDIRSFKRIFEHYVPLMRPIALHYARTVFEADDILQDSFVRVYTSLKTYKHQGSFDGWIRRVVVNIALNMIRSNRQVYSIMDHFNVEDEFDLIEEDESYKELEAEDPEFLLKLINTLPDGYRMVLSLYVFEDLSHKEISEKLGISEGTSRSQYAKAKKYMIKMLAKQKKER